MNLSDFFEKDPIFTFNLGVSILGHLLILLFVDEYWLCWMILRDGLHLRQLLPVQTQVLVSPLPGKNLRRTCN
jgi:hypothetical protein